MEVEVTKYITHQQQAGLISKPTTINRQEGVNYYSLHLLGYCIRTTQKSIRLGWYRLQSRGFMKPGMEYLLLEFSWDISTSYNSW